MDGKEGRMDGNSNGNGNSEITNSSIFIGNWYSKLMRIRDGWLLLSRFFAKERESDQ